MLSIYIEAPFAACRTFTAGWYRPTATFLTPSAAYGLLLNIAGIETRLREEEQEHDGKTPASLMRNGLPAANIALGVPAKIDSERDAFPCVQSIFQQLHNYPVGASGKERAASAMGNKYNITPVRREFLSDLRAIICIDADAELEHRITLGAFGEMNKQRYGLPFLGDNQFLLDRLTILENQPMARWYQQVKDDSGGGPRPRTTRLTIWIDRADLSKSSSALFAPTAEATTDVPEDAWVQINPPQ